MVDRTRPSPEPQTQQPDKDFSLGSDLVRDVLVAIEAEDEGRLAALLTDLHPADVADLMEQMGERPRRLLIRFWGRGIDGETLSELDEGLRLEVIQTLPDDVVSEAVRELDSDDVVDLVEDLDDVETAKVLDALSASDRAAVEQALSFPEYSAGRLMQREVMQAPEFWRVGDAIDFMRANDAHLPEQFYHVILVNPRHQPIGYVQLGKLLGAGRATLLRDITEDSFRTVKVDQPEADVAYAFNQYHLISMPVVDAADRLVGVITIDDAMTVLDEEHEEDILRLAGVGEESSLNDSTLDTVRQRLPWLAVNLATSILASIVIGLFDAALGQIVALAILMPIVASMGGNAGTQSLTVAVRALATKDLTGSNLRRVALREVAVGAINGLVFAVAMGLVAAVWFANPTLGLVMAFAMVVNLVVAAMAGILIPVALDKAGVDPALASGTFVTTVTDVVGFLAFLGVAASVLL